MTIEVVETRIAEAQAAGLRGPARKAYEGFLDELAHRGCAALGYRVTGPEPLPRLCVRHLRGNDRVVVAFERADRAWIVLVGAHDTDPGVDVYQALYKLVGIVPTDRTRRTKPSCCEPVTGRAPTAEDAVIDELVRRARSLARPARRTRYL
ncbi:hypothetical protein GCM10010174_03970 [Kutzneria viridogrisea]|uniref:Uncharacterized protein n=1 Tax=Kutzneria viridogrisea TaxID=47990 RepID=A0ABR6BSG7_9PSEU|nr:hypothetical protein [Kutzneria viridogrisea]